MGGLLRDGAAAVDLVRRANSGGRRGAACSPDRALLPSRLRCLLLFLLLICWHRSSRLPNTPSRTLPNPPKPYRCIHRHEGAYYRHRNAIIAFHRLTRIACVVPYAAARNISFHMPAPLLGTGGAGGGMWQLLRTLIVRGGLPYPWIYVLNFPVPFPLQARARRSGSAHGRSHAPPRPAPAPNAHMHI